MNYLAHAYLSFNNTSILLGNMCSDFIKGKKQFSYSEAIQKGIQLHRAIDTFTDEHAVTREMKLFFRPAYRLYSGAFIDVVYDHFLANDEQHFTDASLKIFAENVYVSLEKNSGFLPEKFSVMLPYMHSQNWLYNYRNRWGIQKSFEGLVRRAAYLTESKVAFELFEAHYDALKFSYESFFPALYAFARKELERLTISNSA